MGLGFAAPLGFSNSYALATTAARAKDLTFEALETCATIPSSPSRFRRNSWDGRTDGRAWRRKYQLPHVPRGIDHGLAYSALADGTIHVTDIYTTDAKIAELGLAVLQDDAGYFPRYDAVLLYRLDLPTRAPNAWKALSALEGRIDTARMIRMNGDAELRGRSFADIARDFHAGGAARGASPHGNGGGLGSLTRPDLGRLTREHILLVVIPVGIATLLSIPLGALPCRFDACSNPFLRSPGCCRRYRPSRFWPR